MKNWLPSLFAAVLISGCSTIPSTPKPHPQEYAIQVLEVELPGILDLKKLGNSGWIDEILRNPDAKIYEYPTLYAVVGESVTNNQTKLVSMAENFSVVEGKAVAKEKVQKLGRSVGVSISTVEDNVITYSVNIHNQELVGFDTYKLEDDITVQMPFFKARSIDTELSQPLGSWRSLGGLADTRTENGNKTIQTQFFCIRIIPPATK